MIAKLQPIDLESWGKQEWSRGDTWISLGRGNNSYCVWTGSGWGQAVEGDTGWRVRVQGKMVRIGAFGLWYGNLVQWKLHGIYESDPNDDS